ncbi:MAG: hypothetical protein GC160_19020 [Acidobacteria bacterium]|nr:hypothetical protein [Acidobacteriota bacterium]
MRQRTHAALRLMELRAYLADKTRPAPANSKHVLIFAQGRTGTTLLESLLCSTGHFDGRGEVLNTYTREVWKPIPYVRGLGRAADGTNLVVHVKGSHLTRARRRLGSVDAVDLLRALDADGWTIVNIGRSSIADQVLSECVALARGGYHKTNDRQEMVRVRIDPAEFMRRYDVRLRFGQEDRAALDQFPHLQLTYEQDLADASGHQSAVDRILDAVGLPHKPVRTSLRKINRAAPTEILENFDEIDAALRGRGFEWSSKVA